MKGVEKEDLIDYSVMCSIMDTTPEGKSTVDLGKQMGCVLDERIADQMQFVEFTAQSKMSGVNLQGWNGCKKRRF